MSLTLAIVALALAGLALLAMVREKRSRNQRRMEQHSITAEELHSLLASHPETLLFDVRQPLDLLAAARGRTDIRVGCNCPNCAIISSVSPSEK